MTESVQNKFQRVHPYQADYMKALAFLWLKGFFFFSFTRGNVCLEQAPHGKPL